jgi:hypothetical protein
MTDRTSGGYPPTGRLRGGFRTEDGLEPTDRSIAHADADASFSGDTEVSSWQLERDIFDETIVGVDVASDGAVLLFVEATDDNRDAGTTVRLEPDAAGAIGSGLLFAADSVTETEDR